MLDFLASLENKLTLLFKPTDQFDRLFEKIRPDLVFNTSHIHAPAGELPVRVAHQKGIATAAFIFSWDNLSSRGRILPPYDHYFVWHIGMREQLLCIYPYINSENVFVTGTPQFDYHFRPTYCLSREELCARLGLNPSRPFILYTTGMDSDFPDEVCHVCTVIDILKAMDGPQKPQLVVRAYAKGTSPEMKALAQQKISDVVFPPILWEGRWFTPKYEDLSLYTSLLHHCALGINPASTVSLELMMLDKPVINIGFDPPGSHLPTGFHWKRHIYFDHYRRVAESGAVSVAWSVDEMREMILRSLQQPDELCEARRAFITQTFGDLLDGRSGQRVADTLISLVYRNNTH